MVVIAVIGGQWGSEGKGVIVNDMAEDFQVHVRVGGPNAGHSFYHKDKLYKMQSIPCGWTNPTAQLFLGAGALVDPETLFRELEMIEDHGSQVLSRLYIDGNASVLEPKFREEEGGVDGELHRRIGSTGHGVGAVRHARMSRDTLNMMTYKTFYDRYKGQYDGYKLPYPSNTARMLELERKNDSDILLEGTQGSGLSLTHGPWPYVTSADTNAATLAADAGIPPKYVRTLMVVRTFPIRVAGNSGPMFQETDWETISKRMGRPTTESTTVTKKTRRVGLWDQKLFEHAVTLNAPDWIATTFLDYLNPADEGNTNWQTLSNQSREFINKVEHWGQAPVIMAGTGGPRWSIAHRPMPRFHWWKGQ